MFTSPKTLANRGFAEGACKVTIYGTNAVSNDSTRAESLTPCYIHDHEAFDRSPLCQP